MLTREGDGLVAETYQFESLGRRPLTLLRLAATPNRALGRGNAALAPVVPGYPYATRAGGAGRTG
jgi:hypothetical protein